MRRPALLSVRLAAFTAAGNLIGGAHMPFFPSWMESKGLSATDIGLVIALMGIIRVITGPLLSFAADAAERQRATIILLTGSAVLSYAAYFWANDFVWILAWSLTTSAAWSAISPLFESITLRSAQAHGFEYGRVRLWGTAAFVVANIVSGQLVQAYGIDVFLPFITTAGLITFLAAWGVPQLPALRQADSRRRDQAKTAVRLALHPVFILFVLAAACAQAQHGFYYGFATLDWKAQGFSASLAGALWAIGPIAEIILFWYGASVRRTVSPAALLAIAGASGAIKWTVMAFQPSLWVLFPLQILHAGTFAAAHLGAMQFILRAVPPGLAATGQAVYASVTYGVVMAGAQFVSGQLFHAYGSAGYLAMSALGAISLILSLWLVRAWSGELLLKDGSQSHESDRDPAVWPSPFEADGTAGSGEPGPRPSQGENDGRKP
jgi:MFS transporter, PPP family, 3-phenylpropionic acid transporter